MIAYVFDLYIAGDTARSRRAVSRMREICEGGLQGESQLNIIDVLDDPAAAEEAKIIVTPTLIKRSPAPGLRILGDLSDRDALNNALNLKESKTA